MLPAWRQTPAWSLPHGRSLPESVWRQRHRFITGLVALHVVALPLFGLYMGEDLLHVVLEGTLILCLLALALLVKQQTLQATFASLGLITSSAILVHFSGGYIEAHFHFFVSLAFITLYQEWVPFAVTVAVTVLHHGVVGALDPTSVYNHPAALASPWKWAIIHGLFVFGACFAYVVQWRLNEQARDETELVLDAAGDAIIGVDLEHQVTFANPAAHRLFGPRPVGRPLASLLGPLEGLDSRVRQRGETHVSATGAPVEVTLSPILQRGTLVGHVLTVADISQRRQAEEERLRHRDEQVRRLKELDELKTSFINTVAHELRTPMTPLRLQAELLRRTTTPDALKAVEVLDRNLSRLHRLVDDVLDATRLQARRLVLDMEPMDLRGAIDQAVAMHRPMAATSDARFEVLCPEGIQVTADPARLAQMLNNLIANAMRSAPGGTVRIIGAEDGEVAMVQVHDDGAGLTKQQMARLFQPFAQVDDSNSQHQSTGLGLYLARELARLHGGDVTVASAGPRRGTTFTVTLPVVARTRLVVQ